MQNIRQGLFASDGKVPNSHLSALIYPQSVNFTGMDMETARRHVDEMVGANGWYYDWTGSVYRFTHYHPNAHELLVVYRGYATLELGGIALGEQYRVKKGDAVIIPAGVGHRRVASSSDFKVFGCYPDGQEFKTYHAGKKRYNEALPQIEQVKLPLQDPIFGRAGPLLSYWNTPATVG